MQAFFSGQAANAYCWFGAHPTSGGVQFRVYAPHAAQVLLISSAHAWEPVSMQKNPQGIFTLLDVEAQVGDLYKYRIVQRNGSFVDKADPYGFQMELRPNTASIITDLDAYAFQDAAWMRERHVMYNRPMNIYELHCGSWRQNPREDPEADPDWFSYTELADTLIPYLLEHHYTHVELLPLSEHPLDASWGYQTSGFFAVTSRYGTPQQFMEFVDRCHANHIGVILDFVPVHFVRDAFSLLRFDGTPLYEYDNDAVGCSEWGTCNFDYYKAHVRSFLISAADFWLSVYHVDGLRMDAICNAVYWQGDAARGVNIGGVQFLRDMNAILKQRHPTAMLIAEDSSNFLKVTAPVQYEGLGFDYKWDMGWMNDTLELFKLPVAARRQRYHQLAFSMQYFQSELYLLPFSHDEVVHGKATILQKMWGDYDVKFPQARTLYLYMYTHPGKKLNFMGNELGHFREWDEKRELDWDLLKYPLHDSFCAYLRALSGLYCETPALFDGEYDPSNFRWLEVQAPQACVYAYLRRAASGGAVIAVLNLSDQAYDPFYVGLDAPMAVRELLNSDAFCWSGGGMTNGDGVWIAQKKAHNGHSYRLPIRLAPFGSCLLEVQ